jgi:hypothetical protein
MSGSGFLAMFSADESECFKVCELFSDRAFREFGVFGESGLAGEAE